MNAEQPRTERAEKREGVHNINDNVWVKITRKGEQVFDEYYRQYEETLVKANVSLPRVERDPQGYTKMQLHEVMRIFGPHLYNGNPDLVIETEYLTKDPNEK